MTRLATVRSTEAAELIGLLEELLERRVVALVVHRAAGEVEFVVPGAIADEALARLLEVMAAAAQNARRAL